MVRGRDSMAILVATLLALALALVGQGRAPLRRRRGPDGRDALRGARRPRAERRRGVAIDDVTFSDLERQWPFPRSLHARAIDALRKAGARRIVYDVQFTEPTSEREDLALFNAVGRRAGDVVLATTETDGHGGTNVLGGDENVHAARAHAAAGEPQDRPRRRHPSLPAHLGRPGQRRRRGRRPPAARRREPPFDDERRVDRLRRPARHDPDLPASATSSTARVDPAELRGRVVVVGATAPTLQDVHSTPTASDRLMSGPEIQANAISTALRGLPLRDAPRWTGVLALLLLGTLPALAHLRTARAQGRRGLPARRARVRGRRADRVRRTG